MPVTVFDQKNIQVKAIESWTLRDLDAVEFPDRWTGMVAGWVRPLNAPPRLHQPTSRDAPYDIFMFCITALVRKHETNVETFLAVELHEYLRLPIVFYAASFSKT